MTFSSTRLASLLGFEVLFLLITIPRLARRGWRFANMTRAFEPRDLLRGLGVWFLGYLIFVAGYYLAWAISPTLGTSIAQPRVGGHPTWAIILLASLFNPFFEEFVWLGYAVPGPARWQPMLAVLWSVVPRCLVHAYQGWPAILYIAPLGLWYLRYYYRTQRFWPVVIAHGLQDLLSLALLRVHGAG